MWVFTKIGFFSITKARPEEWPNPVPEGSVQVRARVREDLENFLEATGASVEVIETYHRDYPYRIFVSPETAAKFLFEYVEDMDYNNFKNEVAAVQGKARASLYSKVWSVMYNAEGEV